MKKFKKLARKLGEPDPTITLEHVYLTEKEVEDIINSIPKLNTKYCD